MNDESRKADTRGAPLSAAGARPVEPATQVDAGTSTEAGHGVIVAGAAARARGDKDAIGDGERECPPRTHGTHETHGTPGHADRAGDTNSGVDPPRHAIAGRPAPANGAAEQVDPARERAYWRESFRCRDYVEPNASFEDYGPAYDLGVRARAEHPQQGFDEVESAMASDWAAGRGGSRLNWERAQAAVRDAWNRLSPTSRGRA